MTMQQLDNQITTYRALLAQKEELEAQIEAIRDSLKAKMVETGSEVLEGSDWVARWINVNSQRFDSKRFKEENPGLYGSYCKPTTTTRFTVSA